MATVKRIQEKCYVTLTEDGGSNIEFSQYTKDIDINGGKIPREVENFNIGQTQKIGRQEPYDIDFSGLRAIDTSLQALKESDTDAQALTSGYAFLNGSKDKRLAILWTNQPGVTSAAQAITGSYWGLRLTFKDGGLTDNPLKWEDFMLNGEMNYFTSAYDETGGGNMQIQKCNINTSGQSMGALGSYTAGGF